MNAIDVDIDIDFNRSCYCHTKMRSTEKKTAVDRLVLRLMPSKWTTETLNCTIAHFFFLERLKRIEMDGQELG